MQTILKLLKAFGPIKIGPKSITVWNPKSYNVEKLRSACDSEGLRVSTDDRPISGDPYVRVMNDSPASDEDVLAKLDMIKQ